MSLDHIQDMHSAGLSEYIIMLTTTMISIILQYTSYFIGTSLHLLLTNSIINIIKYA